MAFLARIIGSLVLLVLVPLAALQAYVNADNAVPPAALQLNGMRLGEIARANTVSLEEEQVAFSPSPAALSLAREAFAREPLSADALFVLAIDAIYAGDEPTARAMIDGSSELQKRNIYVGLLSLAASIQDKNADEAFGLLNQHVLVNPTHTRVLLSTLSDRLFELTTVDEIGALLDERPEWESAFWSVMSRNPESLDDLITLRLRESAVPDRMGDQALVRNLIAAGRFADAFRIWRAVDEGATHPLGFANSESFAPLGWELAQRGNVYATLGGDRMALFVARGRRAVFAEQVVLLTAGKYRLTVDGPGADDPNIFANYRCASQERGKSARIPFGESFTVDGSCNAYLLMLEADTLNTGDLQTEIDVLDLQRIG
ncbi:MAG: hypothetical protein WBA68_01845 [Alteraurantiacibacter sp.]